MPETDMNKDRITQLERIFQVPARLKIMAALLSRNSIDFTELVQLLDLTRGNLSVHMKLLNDHKYVKIIKKFVKNKPKTIYQITELGKNDFKDYVAILESIIANLGESQ